MRWSFNSYQSHPTFFQKDNELVHIQFGKWCVYCWAVYCYYPILLWYCWCSDAQVMVWGMDRKLCFLSFLGHLVWPLQMIFGVGLVSSVSWQWAFVNLIQSDCHYIVFVVVSKVLKVWFVFWGFYGFPTQAFITSCAVEFSLLNWL